ncbi:MAG: DUF465 domain-containing protein [Pseudomonadota bacterium]
MEQRDLELIKKYCSSDEKLKRLYDEHIDLEKKLEDLSEKSYLTPEEETEKARLKKVKLKGRDAIEVILSKYRQVEK